MLNVINNKYDSGFYMTFQNGLTISVQFGSGNYCENRSFNPQPDNPSGPTISPDAEIAIWDADNNWFDFGSDTVKGYVSVDEVAFWIYNVQQATNLSDVKAPS